MGKKDKTCQSHMIEWVSVPSVSYQSMDTSKVQLGEPMSYRSYSQDYGWGVTYRSRSDSRTVVSLKATWVTAHKSSADWRAFFPGDSVGLSHSLAVLCFFQAAGLVSSSQLHLSESYSAILIAYTVEEGPSDCG